MAEASKAAGAADDLPLDFNVLSNDELAAALASQALEASCTTARTIQEGRRPSCTASAEARARTLELAEQLVGTVYTKIGLGFDNVDCQRLERVRTVGCAAAVTSVTLSLHARDVGVR